MKVIFLDHDGVICLANDWGSRRCTDHTTIDGSFDSFDKKAIKVLNKIIEKTDCEIVVSSDWRLYTPLEQMQELYKIRGIKKSPIAYTESKRDLLYISDHDSAESVRCQEIRHYLKEHPEVTHWVAVDDMWMGIKPSKLSYRLPVQEWGLENFVHTPFSYEGIKQTDVKNKILKFLR